MIMKYTNIVFDLGGVVFARDPRKCSDEMISFFSFVAKTGTPEFWDEYDRGALSLDEVKEAVCRYRNCDRDTCERMFAEAVGMQEEIAATKRLIGELKNGGYKLYVLSNMSREFIGYLRTLPVYAAFDGEVVSCEEGSIKPEPEIFGILLSRYSLDPSRTLFIDDREANTAAASALGIDAFLFDNTDPEKSCAELRERLLRG